MAFSEERKLQVKKRAHFCCCLCHALGVDVHHIIPQSEGGLDLEDNAAPLCPSCHETYGANPQKRKFIRETRDFWYELCDKRFATDTAKLEQIADRIERTATKDDIQKILDRLASAASGKESKDMISIELHQYDWLVILVWIDSAVRASLARISEMREAGFDFDAVEEQLSEHEITVLVSPIRSRGVIIDTLVGKGILKPEASKAIGWNTIQSVAIEWQQRRTL